MMEDEAEVIVKDQKDDENNKHEIADPLTKKHEFEKEALLEYHAKILYPTMRHYINCDFNLLIYGVGSKKLFLNYFAFQYLKNFVPALVFHGYHSASNMK